MAKNHNSLKFRLKDGLAVSVLRLVLLVSAVFPLEVSRAMGRGFSRLLLAADTQTVRIVRRNIDLAYPHLSRDDRVRLL